MSNQVTAPARFTQFPPEGRLDSWKEIGAYLRRDVRTVQRWEKTAKLPVHRLQSEKQGSVYAYKSELIKSHLGPLASSFPRFIEAALALRYYYSFELLLANGRNHIRSRNISSFLPAHLF